MPHTLKLNHWPLGSESECVQYILNVHSHFEVKCKGFLSSIIVPEHCEK